MTTHTATINWQRGEAPFTPADFSRDHQWEMAGGQIVNASAAPQFRGNPDCVDPEAAFTASLSSCHMLTFLYLAAKSGLTVDHYQDHAEGTLGKTSKGMAMVKVVLRPEIRFAGSPPSPQVLDELHQQAHKDCFIANSVTTEIIVEGSVQG